MKTSQQAHELSKVKDTKNMAAEWKTIESQIDYAVACGQFSVNTIINYPENLQELTKLGYITASILRNTGIIENCYEISWE